MPASLGRVYSSVGETETQINNGDTMQNELSSPGHEEGRGCGESSLEKVTVESCQNLKMRGTGKEERWRVKAFGAFLTRFSFPVKFLHILQQNLVLFT